jgi:hypothetical protein
MKLKAVHLLLILLCSLLLCLACNSVKEGLTNKTDVNNVHSQYVAPAGDTVDVYSNASNNKISALPAGIPASQIPLGDEDMYILKSQIVPPVCPACPTTSECPRQTPCAPCPPCGRCPEPSFECKKVPNYAANDDNSLPRPVLSDFSQFGM